MRFAWVLVAGCLLVPSSGYAKSPPSAFGDAFDKSASSAPRGRDDDDAYDGAPNDRGPAKMQKVKRPNPNRRHKIMLDGSQGSTRNDDDDDDVP